MVSIKHKKVLTIPDDPDAVAAGMVVSSDWNDDLDTSMATARILGRDTAGTGAIEELDAATARALLQLVKGTSAGNIPVLDGSGKLDTSILPSLAITETFVVNSQAAMLALSAQAGDVAIRTDLNKTFILSTNSPTSLADWKEMLTPADAVLPVAGLTGAISAAALKTALAIAVADITDMSASGRVFVALSSYANMFNAIKQAASDTVTGVVELATNTEAIAGTDTTRAVTPAGLAAALAAGGGTVIQSIQTGYASTGSANSGSGEDGRFLDVTISAVVAAKSVVILYGLAGSSGGSTITSGSSNVVSGRLTSATNLRLSAAGGAFSNIYARWTVVEYK